MTNKEQKFTEQATQGPMKDNQKCESNDKPKKVDVKIPEKKEKETKKS